MLLKYTFIVALPSLLSLLFFGILKCTVWPLSVSPSPIRGILTAAGTPRGVVDRLVAEVHKAVSSPDVKDKLAASGIDTVTSTPEQFGELIRSETVRYAKVIKAAGIKAE